MSNCFTQWKNWYKIQLILYTLGQSKGWQHLLSVYLFFADSSSISPGSVLLGDKHNINIHVKSLSSKMFLVSSIHLLKVLPRCSNWKPLKYYVTHVLLTPCGRVL